MLAGVATLKAILARTIGSVKASLRRAVANVRGPGSGERSACAGGGAPSGAPPTRLDLSPLHTPYFATPTEVPSSKHAEPGHTKGVNGYGRGCIPSTGDAARGVEPI